MGDYLSSETVDEERLLENNEVSRLWHVNTDTEFIDDSHSFQETRHICASESLYGRCISDTRARCKIYWIQILAASLWIALIVVLLVFIQNSDNSVGEILFDTLTRIGNSPWGPILFVVLYVIRLPLFIPGTALTIFAGFLFGPWKGETLVIIGANISAICAYYIGMFFGTSMFNDENIAARSELSDENITASEGDSSSLLERYTERLRSNSFETVLIMRLIFLPYDLVSYVAGFLRIHLWQFFLATLLGILPGSTSFVLLGSSSTPEDMKQFVVNGKLPRVDWRMLVGSAIMFVLSMLVSQYFKRRSQR